MRHSPQVFPRGRRERYSRGFFAAITSRKRLARPGRAFLLAARDDQRIGLDIAVITEPAPTIAPAPIDTGATKRCFEPMNAPAPITVCT